MLVPGTWDLHIKGKIGVRAVLLFLLTLLVYTAYYLLWIHPVSLFVIPELSSQFRLILTAPLVLYNAIFLIRFIQTTHKEHHLGKK